MNEFLKEFRDFISTNQTPPQDKIAVALMVILCFSVIMFILSGILFYLRKVNLLGLRKYSLINLFFWSLGSVLLGFIVIITKIVNYNIVAFLVIGIAWDSLYKKLFDKAKDKDLGEIDSIEKDPS